MEPADRAWLEDRIRGCLAAAAIGDAMGAPVEGVSREEIAARHPGLLRELLPARDGEPAGRWTDDASQLMLLARELAEHGRELSEEAWTAALVGWLRHSPDARFAGPTTRARLEALSGGTVPPDLAGDPRLGVSNGAAMRVAPAGLVHPGDDSGAAHLAHLTARPTHDTSPAVSAAAAVAAGIAEALRPGADVFTVLDACADGAFIGEQLAGRHVASPSVGRRIDLALAAFESTDVASAIAAIDRAVGTSVLAIESVPAAIAIFAASGGDPLEAIVGGVNIGGDADTIACIAGALAGALSGASALPPELVEAVERANGVDFAQAARDLAAVAAEPADDEIR